MATTKTRDRWVVCDEYAAGPYSEARAASELAAIERLGICHGDHHIVVSAAQPAIRRADPMAWAGDPD